MYQCLGQFHIPPGVVELLPEIFGEWVRAVLLPQQGPLQTQEAFPSSSLRASSTSPSAVNLLTRPISRR